MHLYKRKNGYYYVTLSNKKRISTKKKKKSEALLVAKLLQKQVDEELKDKITFGVYSDKFFLENVCPWVEDKREHEHRLSSRWVEIRRGHLNNWLLPYFSEFKIQEIDSKIIKTLFKKLNCSGTMKNKILDSLKIILDYAVEEGLIKENPINKRLKYSEKTIKIRDVFTKEEIFILFPLKQEKLITIWETWENALFFATLAYTGIRPSEARALIWEDIQDDCIMIHKSLSDKNISYTKTETSIRTVPISIELRWFFERTKREEDTFVFPNFLVNTRNRYLRPFKRALKRVNIDDSDRNLVPYSFRHTFNTLAFQTLGQEELREVMGHASEEMTMRYLHLSKKLRQERAIKKAQAIHKAFILS